MAEREVIPNRFADLVDQEDRIGAHVVSRLRDFATVGEVLDEREVATFLGLVRSTSLGMEELGEVVISANQALMVLMRREDLGYFARIYGPSGYRTIREVVGPMFDIAVNSKINNE